MTAPVKVANHVGSPGEVSVADSVIDGVAQDASLCEVTDNHQSEKQGHEFSRVELLWRLYADKVIAYGRSGDFKVPETKSTVDVNIKK